jgi:hypothetical protein
LSSRWGFRKRSSGKWCRTTLWSSRRTHQFVYLRVIIYNLYQYFPAALLRLNYGRFWMVLLTLLGASNIPWPLTDGLWDFLWISIRRQVGEYVFFGANLICILVTFPASSAALPQFIEGVSISRWISINMTGIERRMLNYHFHIKKQALRRLLQHLNHRY